MPLTPQEVASKVFGPTRMRRGYDENEVDAFLDAVEAELTRLTAENESLRRELEKAGHGSSATRSAAPAASLEKALPDPAESSAPPAAVAVPDVPVEQQVARMLVLAQQTADAAISEAQIEADRTRGAAKIEADRVLTEARARAAEEIGTLERSKAALEGEVERLQAFEREYRSRLRAYLSLQLKDLESDTAGPAAVEAGDTKVLELPDTADAGPVETDTSSAGSNGLQDPPGFGAVWSPTNGGREYPNVDPLIGAPRESEARYGVSSFNTLAPAQWVSGYGSTY